MSHRLGFTILPFDCWLIPNPEIQLPIDLAEFAQRLHALYPAGEIEVFTGETYTAVRLYISTEDGPWMVAQLAQGKNTILDVSGWPKALAVKIILWYREYISAKYPLFLIDSDTGEGIQLAENTSAQDIENAYPSNWIIGDWNG